MLSTVAVLMLATVAWAQQPSIRPLACHSVSPVPEGHTTQYIFLTHKKNDCTFIFEGPPHTQLELRIQSIPLPKSGSTKAEKSCAKHGIRIYDYDDNGVALNRLVCPGSQESRVITRSNIGIMSSLLSEGMVITRVRPQRPVQLRELIGGMTPPSDAAEDFFYADHLSNSIQEDVFETLTRLNKRDDFRPSRPFPLPPESPDTMTFYQAPQQQQQQHQGRHYPGKPTAIVDLTYNSTEAELTTVTFPHPNHTHVTSVSTSGRPAQSTPEPPASFIPTNGTNPQRPASNTGPSSNKIPTSTKRPASTTASQSEPADEEKSPPKLRK